MNNGTSATAPLRPVAENAGVILERIYGLIESDGQGPFALTDKGRALHTLLSHTPEEEKEAVAKQFLGI